MPSRGAVWGLLLLGKSKPQIVRGPTQTVPQVGEHWLPTKGGGGQENSVGVRTMLQPRHHFLAVGLQRVRISTAGS